MSQTVGFPSPTWETWTEFPAPSLQLLWTLAEVRQHWGALLLSAPHIKNKNCAFRRTPGKEKGIFYLLHILGSSSLEVSEACS